MYAHTNANHTRTHPLSAFIPYNCTLSHTSILEYLAAPSTFFNWMVDLKISWITRWNRTTAKRIRNKDGITTPTHNNKLNNILQSELEIKTRSQHQHTTTNIITSTHYDRLKTISLHVTSFLSPLWRSSIAFMWSFFAGRRELNQRRKACFRRIHLKDAPLCSTIPPFTL